MQAGIQISSFKPMLTDLNGLKSVLSFMHGIGCAYTQLQWIDRSIPVQEIASALDSYGIRALSVQDKAYAVFEDADHYLALCRRTGAGDLCVSSAADMGTDTFLREIETLYKEVRDPGFTLSFHPTKRDFETALDRIMLRCPYLRLTLDLCQAHDAGAHAADIIERYRGRIDIVHLKDRGQDGALCAVGQGVIDLENAARACCRADVKTLLAEQESWQNAFSELRQGFEYTKSLAEKLF